MRVRTPDLVVGVWDEVPPDLGEGVGDPGVRLRGRREGRDLHVEVVVQVRVLRLRRVAQVLLLELGEWRKGYQELVLGTANPCNFV